MRPPCGEYALNSLLQVGAWAKKPLIDRLPILEMPVSFFYGEFDWMDGSHAIILIQTEQVKG
jgi:hypothetical protein